jgi:hypothetical protein
VTAIGERGVPAERNILSNQCHAIFVTEDMDAGSSPASNIQTDRRHDDVIAKWHHPKMRTFPFRWLAA